MEHINSSLAASHFGNADSFSWQSATGPLVIPMTNDYLFRALLQKNNKVLKGLICALLHLNPEDVESVVITNPIELGKAFDEKTFILDIKVNLNYYTIINLEMQVINEQNWTERSLSYLCRNFDHLKAGEQYQTLRPVIQIGLLNFTLFPDCPEFYSTYQLLNVKNHTLYSDKLRISVLDLTQIDLATEEDRRYQLDYWAALFKSTTWEELRMLAKDNEYIADASDTIYKLSQEERIRMECEAREDYYRRQRGIQCMLDTQAEAIEQLTSEKAVLTSEKEALILENEKLRAWAKEHGYHEL